MAMPSNKVKRRRVKTSHRTGITLTVCAALTAFQTFVMAASLPADLQRGKDRVDIPAIGEGLCLHNLFQSNMVIQRDKPVKIWGWVSPGEKVMVMLDGKQRSVTAGEDRRFQPAKARYLVLKKDSRNRPVYDYKTIVLSSRHVANPIHYRYAWGRNPMGNLKPRYNFDSAILATQRSDDWKIHEVPIKFGDKANRHTINLVRQANRMFDMERRLKDAKFLLDEHQDENAAELKKWQDKWE